jgi:2'-5' RNA ligase
VRAALAAMAHEAQALCGGRAAAPANIHLTLFFVGDVERERSAALEEAAGEARGASFELAIDRVGYWRHNRIVWAGTSACPAALIELESSLRAVLARLGLRGEERPYAPHITLVRDAARKPAPAVFAPLAWPVSEFVLVESVPRAGGVSYEPRARWRL